MVTAKLSLFRTSEIVALLLVGLFSFLSASSANEQTGTLQLTITDTTTGEPVPARVEVRGADGAYHIATDALLVGGDCDMSDQGAGYVDRASTLAGFSNSIVNHYMKFD